MKLHFIILSLLVMGPWCISCRQPPSVPRNAFALTDSANLLCFDLVKDDAPRGWLLMRNRQDSPVIGSMLLPFGIKDIGNDRKYYTATGDYEDYTLVYYKNAPSAISPCELSFRPAFAAISEGNQDVMDEPDKGIYFIRDGLNRKFIFNYDLQRRLRRSVGLSLDSLRQICISVPEDADVMSKYHGRALTAPVKSDKNFLYFAGSSTEEGKPLRMYYNLQTSPEQNKLLDICFKLLALMTPFLSLYAYNKTTEDEKRKKTLVTFLVILEFAVFAAATYLAIRAGWSLDSIADYGLAVVGGVIAFLTVRISSKK